MTVVSFGRLPSWRYLCAATLVAALINVSPVHGAGSGTTPQDPGLSCKAILASGQSTGDGIYWIDPNGGMKDDAFQAYCDMTTDGGGWTLAVNSVVGEEPPTTDMTSNTGVPGIDRGHTRDLTNLAVNNDAQIRYYIDDPQNGRLFHAKSTRRYHDPLLPFTFWTTLPGHLPGSDTLLTRQFGRPWSTSLADHTSLFTNGACPAFNGSVPWHYGVGCWTSIPTNQVNGLTQGPETGGVTMTRFSIFVREVGTIVAFPDPASRAKLRPAVNHPTGTGPVSVAAGDFDQDGRLDLVTLNSGNDTVTVRFSAGGVTQFPAGGTQPAAIAIGYFNADTRLDLVVAHTAEGSRAVVFANTGSGFAPMTTIAGCIGFSDIEAADFDGNGTTDLAYQCQSNPGVGIAFGNGDGSFVAGPFLPTSLMAPTSLAVADLNGDGRLDIIGFGGTTGCLAVMLNFGSFSTSQQCFGTTPLMSGAIADLNDDGRPDIVATTSGAVRVLQNVDGLQFTVAGSYPLPAGVGEVTVGDVNEDGRTDVIAVPSTLRAVAVFSGNDDLTLQPAPELFNVSSPPRSVAVADFDGDGRLDVASADNATDSVSLLYNSRGDNYAPIASDGAITATEGATRNGTLSAFDPNDEAMTFALVTTGSKGTATLTNAATGAFTYAANAGADGTDTFTFTASDGVNTSNVGKITVTIGPRQMPRVTWVPPAPIRYGTPLNVAQLNATASVGGSFSYSPSFFTVLGAGASQTLMVTFTPFNTALYTTVTTSVAIDVLPAPLAVKTSNATIVFGQSLPAFTATYGGLVNGDTPASLGGALTFTGPASTNAGSYSITPGGLTSSNYAIDFQPGTLVIQPAPVTVSLTATPPIGAVFQPVKLTAAISVPPPAAGVPSGNVRFADNGTIIGTAPLSAGVATLIAGLAPGPHSLTAEYLGGGNFAASGLSAPASVTIRPFTESTLTIAYSAGSPTALGQRATLKAGVVTLTGSTVPTGTVVFLDGAVVLGTAPLVNSGLTLSTATLSTTALAAGPHFITAVYLGSAALAPSVSSPAVHNVYSGTPPVPATLTLSSSGSPSIQGQPVTFTATITPSSGTPTGTVVFLADNALIGTATLSVVGGAIRAQVTTSGLSMGLHIVCAIYVGDGVFGASAATPISHGVQ